MYLEPFKELGNTDDWKLILGFGIVNPFGPTLNLLLKEKDDDEVGEHRTSLISVHPFGPKVLYMWKLREDNNKMRQEIISSIIGTMDATPTLYLPGDVKSDPATVLPLLIYIAACKADGVDTLNSIRKYLGDPIKRIDAEMDNIDLEDILSDSPKEGPLDFSKAEELVRLQLEPDNINAELQAYKYAYEGSIRFSGLEPTLDYDDMNSLLFMLIRSECNERF